MTRDFHRATSRNAVTFNLNPSFATMGRTLVWCGRLLSRFAPLNGSVHLYFVVVFASKFFKSLFGSVTGAVLNFLTSSANETQNKCAV